ncbi:MAG: Xaa-Pro peptidase family protein [Synergistetes bacterium]|nr:Xaa-Pro peptidase family protein [Synergistota bacterium]MCX8128245.1 Xaa-Pro peptidase family protein [Synergistota bacterium]MDW8192692.1 Xaa-Pro peptidase family protein [Synergistota bacterium]
MKRWQKAFNIAALKGCEAYIISKPVNIRYLTGYRGEAALVLLMEDSIELFTDFRCLEDAEKESIRDCKVYEVPNSFSLLDFVIDRLKKRAVKKVAIESRFVSYEFFEKISSSFGVCPIPSGIEELRKIKSDEEIEKIRKAGEIVSRGYEWLLEKLKPGISEREIEIQLEAFLKSIGGEDRAFPFIIAANENAAKPHSRPSLKTLNVGDCIICDYGVTYDGYNVDVTRTLLLGKVPTKLMEIYKLVKEVQEEVLRSIKVGMEAKKLYELSLKLLGSWKEFFKHSLGHGVGLEIHEMPKLSLNSEEVLEEGMVITIEPGVYLRGEFGIRIEDTIVIRKGAVEILTPISKEGVLCL